MNDSSHVLLVHGGSHGAWCWDSVVAELDAVGISASAFDLPGCGEDMTPRAHLTLDDYTQALVEEIDALPAGPVRVVGHSNGGWLLPFAAAARPEKVAEIIFVAGVALRRNERGIDMVPPERRPGYFKLAAQSPDDSLLLTFEAAWQRFFQHLSESRAREVYSKLTPNPLGVYLTKARVGVEDVATPRRYIALTDDLTFPDPFTAAFAETAGVKREWVEGDHCVMLSAPHNLVAAIS
ncbi:MAG: alpha/beta fold hydrolase [Actinomycetes bacterium]